MPEESRVLAASETIIDLLKKIQSLGSDALKTFLQRLPWIKMICLIHEDKLPDRGMLHRFLENPYTITPQTFINHYGDREHHGFDGFFHRLAATQRLVEEEILRWRRWGIELSDDELYMYQIVLHRLGRWSMHLLKAFDLRVAIIPKLSWRDLLQVWDSENPERKQLLREVLSSYEAMVGSQTRREEMMQTCPGIYLIGYPKCHGYPHPVFELYHRGFYYDECAAVLDQFSQYVGALGITPVANNLPTFLDLVIMYWRFSYWSDYDTDQIQDMFHRLLLREFAEADDVRRNFMLQVKGTEKWLDLAVDEIGGKRRTGRIYPFVMLADTYASGDDDSCRQELEASRAVLPPIVRPEAEK